MTDQQRSPRRDRPAVEAEKIRLLDAVAQAWEVVGVYCPAIHGIEDYPERIGRDIDVMVSRDHFDRAVDATVMSLETSGCEVAVRAIPWGTQVIGFKEHEGRQIGVEIDFATHFQWAIVELAAGTSPRGECEVRGPFWIDTWASFAKGVLIVILSGQFGKLKRREDVLELALSHVETIRTKLRVLVGDSLAAGLLGALERRDFAWVEKNRSVLRRTMLRRRLTRSPLRAIWNFFRWLRNEIYISFLPRRLAPVVALAGPDGVGKSTLIRELEAALARDLVFTGVAVRHWRPRILPKLGSAIGRGEPQINEQGMVPPRRKAGRGYPIRLAYYALDYLIGGLGSDRRASFHLQLVLYDRSFLDMMVDPVRFGMSSTWGMEALRKLLPKPDLVISLTDTAERIYARKPELEIDEIEMVLGGWRKLKERGLIDAEVTIDAPPSEIADRIVPLIVAATVEMNPSGPSKPTA